MLNIFNHIILRCRKIGKKFFGMTHQTSIKPFASRCRCICLQGYEMLCCPSVWQQVISLWLWDEKLWPSRAQLWPLMSSDPHPGVCFEETSQKQGRKWHIQAGRSYLISRLRIICDVSVKSYGHMEWSLSLRSFYMFWTQRHTKINSTSWRKEILETNGHQDSQLMGAKGWNSYWYAHHRPMGSKGARGGHKLLWHASPPNGKLLTELGRS